MKPLRFPATDAGSPGPATITREVHGFVLREARYNPGYRGSVHRHPHPYFGCVIEGEFVERSPRGRSRHARGSVHFHPSNDPHAGIVGAGGARCFSIMPGDRLAGRLDSGAGRDLLAFAPPHLVALAARCHRGFLASDLECEGAAVELAAAVLRLRSPREASAPRWLFAARDFLHAHPCAVVTLAELSGVAGVHPVHLVRVFRHVLGVTPAEYVRRLRLEQACRALAETDVPLAEVALAAGYSSQSHLTRAIRVHLGTTPAAYRRVRRPRPA